MTAVAEDRDHAHKSGGAEVAGANQILTFHLAGNLYGIPLTYIQEISAQTELNRMPHMPKSVEGLLNLRGEVLPVVDLRLRLGLTGEPALAPKILIVKIPGGGVGLKVDAVDSVMEAPAARISPPSPMLEGQEGAWIHGFLVTGERVIALLDPVQAGSVHHRRTAATVSEEVLNLEQRLDDDLQKLLAMAPPKELVDESRIIPQIDSAISFTEQEMGKVIDRVESMLGRTDIMFKNLGLLKHEVGMGRLKGHEMEMVELEGLTSQLQDIVFNLINQIQFQDIARQKLERVLDHLRGLQNVMGQNLRDAKG